MKKKKNQHTQQKPPQHTFAMYKYSKYTKQEMQYL